jgi:hypothetical protein
MKEEQKEQRPDCCADCKKHTNRPSYCHEHKKYVARKAQPCADYKRR